MKKLNFDTFFDRFGQVCLCFVMASVCIVMLIFVAWLLKLVILGF